MSGIYIHVPYCKQKCYYCDFYMVGTQLTREQYVTALLLEIEQRHNYLTTSPNTLYFGGGTPSLLSQSELSSIFNQLNKYFNLSELKEITIEANPDDLNSVYIKSLLNIGFNRISIGVQSFSDSHLKFMHRSHNGNTAKNAVTLAADIGFNNITLDLIYGIPNLSMAEWENNLNIALNLPIKHLSAYHLGIEQGTVFYKFKSKGKLKEIDEQQSINQFEMLQNITKQQGWEHYEISNFAKPNCYSKHNTGYWTNKQYIGFGPSAHSYNLNSRQWNISNVFKYIENINNNNYFEIEQLSQTNKLNEYIITSLRTSWGLNLHNITQNFGSYYTNIIITNAQNYIQSKHIIKAGNILKLSATGMFISDKIFEHLIFNY